jgi:energy-coupling factor transporter ATP-binding protein EcfA2
MPAYYCVWLSASAWLDRRSASTSDEAEHLLGRALRDACAIRATVRDDTGVLRSPDLEEVVPFMLDGPRSRFLRWSTGDLTVETDPAVDLDFARGYPPAEPHPTPVQLLSVDADAVEATAPQQLGAAAYALLDQEHLKSAAAGTAKVLRGATVAARDDCFLVWHRGVARDPRRLSADDESEVRGSRKVRPVTMSRAAAGGRLVPTAAVFSGPRMGGERVMVTLAPGRTSVLFGRNGAGKTLLLSSLAETLGDPFGLSTSEASGVRAEVVLSTAQQDGVAELFQVLLAHIAFQPLSDLPGDARRAPDLLLRGWDSFSAYDSSAGALEVAELSRQHLAVLQDVVGRILDESIAGITTEVGALTRFIATSPCLTVGPEGRVTLTAHTSDAGEEVHASAQRYVIAAEHAAGLTGLQHRIWQLADVILKGGSEYVPVLGVQLAQCVQGVSVDAASGWLPAGEELAGRLRTELPRPVSFAPGRRGPVDFERQIEDAVLDVLARMTGDAAEQGSHPFGTSPTLAERVLDALREEVTSLLPRFVREAGDLDLQVSDPTTWHRHRIRANFRPSGTDDYLPLALLPAGLATWVLGAVTFARQSLLHGRWTGRHDFFGPFSATLDTPQVKFGNASLARTATFGNVDAGSLTVDTALLPLLYLIDEPEVHLHLTAQQDVVELGRNLASRSRGTVVATHALAFLDSPSQATFISTLVYQGGRITVASGGGMTALRDSAEALGISPSALAQLCRGALLVEGKNDVEVIRRYSADIDLDAERVVILPMQGHTGATNLAEAEFLHTLRIPLYVMLDHVRRAELSTALEQGGRLHRGEERTLQQLHESLKEARLGAAALPFDGLDIVTVIPDADADALIQAVGGQPFIGWRELQARADAAWGSHRTKFKDVFRRETGVTVEAVLGQLRGSDFYGGHSPTLVGLLAAMLDDIARQAGVGTSGLRVLKQRRTR